MPASRSSSTRIIRASDFWNGAAIRIRLPQGRLRQTAGQRRHPDRCPQRRERPAAPEFRHGPRERRAGVELYRLHQRDHRQRSRTRAMLSKSPQPCIRAGGLYPPPGDPPRLDHVPPDLPAGADAHGLRAAAATLPCHRRREDHQGLPPAASGRQSWPAVPDRARRHGGGPACRLPAHRPLVRRQALPGAPETLETRIGPLAPVHLKPL